MCAPADTHTLTSARRVMLGEGDDDGKNPVLVDSRRSGDNVVDGANVQHASNVGRCSPLWLSVGLVVEACIGS